MTESIGGTDEHGRPVTWPTVGAARDSLREWADGHDDAHLYVSGLDFRGADPTELHFHYLFAAECNFSGTVLVRTDIAGSYVVDTDFAGADLTEAMLPQAQAADSVFAGALLPARESPGRRPASCVVRRRGSVGGRH